MRDVSPSNQEADNPDREKIDAFSINKAKTSVNTADRMINEIMMLWL